MSIFPDRIKGIGAAMEAASPREDIAVAMFGRVTDLDNFYLVVETLGEDGRISIARRLGYLNMLNPHYADRFDKTVLVKLLYSTNLSNILHNAPCKQKDHDRSPLPF